jgi:hypothetical protein
MLKTSVVNLVNNRTTVIIGLNKEEVESLRTNTGTSAFMIRGQNFGCPVDVVIFSAETEAHALEIISDIIIPETEIVIDDSLKN